jgi:hypothetical protein
LGLFQTVFCRFWLSQAVSGNYELFQVVTSHFGFFWIVNGEDMIFDIKKFWKARSAPPLLEKLILKLICIFPFMLQWLKLFSSDLNWDLICRTLNVTWRNMTWYDGAERCPDGKDMGHQPLWETMPKKGSPDVIEVKESELFQFCDLKTYLHICVHAFPCSNSSNLFPLIFIEILSMSYFVVGQSWCDWGESKWFFFNFVILKLICIFQLSHTRITVTVMIFRLIRWWENFPKRYWMSIGLF